MRWIVMFVVLACLLMAFIQEQLVSADLEDEIRLGVTIRNRDMLERAHSCVHTFSRVELVNQVRLSADLKQILARKP